VRPQVKSQIRVGLFRLPAIIVYLIRYTSA
jgi:hypothetical protein